MKTLINFHVYLYDRVILIPLKRDEQGLWVEVLPPLTVTPLTVAEMERCVTEIINISEDLSSEQPWDGNSGIVWRNTSVLLGARWFDDESWQILPFHLWKYENEKAEWQPDRSKQLRIPASPRSVEEVAHALVQMLSEN
mgnify:FL=1